MPKCSTAQDSVNFEEYTTENDVKLINHETIISDCSVGSNSISAENSPGFNPPKNGLIASALEIPNSVCLSFEHVDPQMDCTSDSLKIDEEVVQDVKRLDLSDKQPKDLCTGQQLESGKSEDSRHNETLQDDELKYDLISPKKFNEVIIDGFAILSFKTKEDMLEFTKLSESQSSGTDPLLEQTYKRARRCGIPKRKRTKGFLKQTLSPTSTSTDLLRHYHHRHYNRHSHHSSKKQHHQQQQEEHPDHHPIYSYNTHYENNHLPGSVHLTPKNNTSIKQRINNNSNNNNDNTVAGITTMTTTTTEINTNNTTNYSHLSPIYPCNNSLMSNNNNNNNNNNTSNHHHHHQHSRHNNYSNEIMNNINSSEKLDHSAVQCMNESLPNYSPYYFTTITSVSSMPSLPNSSVSTASPLSPQSMTTLYNKTNQNRSNNNNNNSNSNNNGVNDDNDRNIQFTEYSSMNSLNHHSDMMMNITSSSSSSPGVWNSQIKMECVPPQKIDKTTYAKLCDIDGVKPLLTNPLSDNCKRTESNNSSNNSNNNNNNNKPHHLFSVAALTDEVMHHSPHSTSDDYKPQLTNIKSPKPSQTNSNNNNKKRMYRRSEQSDTPSSAYDNYDKSSSITHSQRECATYTDRCTTITTDNKNNETPKSGMMMNLTSRNNNSNNNNNIDRIYDNMSKYSSLPLSSSCCVASSSSSPSLSSGHHVVSSNQNFNMNKMMSSGQRNSSIDVSSSASHAHKLSRAGSGEGMLNSMQHNLQFNQFKPMSSVVQSTSTKPSSSVSSTSSVSTNINSNPPLLPHQNLLKQFMGIDSQTANQLFNDPRFMELYALTMATLNGSSTGGRGVDGKEPLSSSHRIPLVNLENTTSNPISNFSQNNNNNNSNNNNASNQIRNGCINEYSRSDPSLLLTETMSSHFGHVNSSGFQNKLYPYNNNNSNSNNNNNSTTGAPPRVPPLSGTNCSTSCTSVNCSPSIKRPPSNSERFSPGNPQTARSQAAVLAAAYADREFLSSHNNNTNSNSTSGKSKSSSSSACTSLPSSRHNNNNNNTSVHNYSMSNNNSSNSSVHPTQRISNFTSMAHSTGSIESVYNSKSNPVNFHHHNHPPPHQHQHPPSSSSSCSSTTNSPMLLSSTRSSSESMMTDRNFSSHPLKLPNGDPYNISLPSLSQDDRNLIGVHKSEHLPPPPLQPPESSAHRSNLPLPMMPPFPSSHIPPEFLKQFFNAESFLFPGSKMNSSSTNSTNMTSSSSASVLSPSSLPSSSSSQQFQSPLLQSMYFPTRGGGGNQPNRTVDKISHTGILHRPVRGDKPYGRWADAHIRVALFIQYCESMQRPQPSSSMPSMFPTCRLPIRPIARRLNPSVHSSVSSSISGQAVQCNPTRLQQHSESGTNRSVNMPPPLIPAPVSQPPRSANNNDNSIPPDASLFWRHLFNEFMNSLSKEFVNNLPDCKDTQMAMLQNFFSHMSQFTSALGGPSSSSSNSTSKLPFSTSTVTPSLSSSLATCSPVTIGSSIGNYSFPLMTQSSNLLRTSPSTSSSSSSTSGVRPSLPPSGVGVGGVSAPVNFNLPTGLLNPEIKRRRTDSFGMDTTNHPGIQPFPPPMRMPPFPRPSNPPVPGVLSHHPPPAPPHHHQDRHPYPPHQHHQSHTHQQHHHQQQQLPVHGAPPPSHPFPGHSDVINNATANFLNGFRLPDTLLNRLPQPPPPQPQPSLHPQHNTGSTSLSNSNTTMNESFPSNDKNSRSSNTTNTASHLVPINPW
ncbi:unnamed protein product [Trichobilharzia szidati]|nr:unnamed protein product [Trichobilharzia szidati]